MCFYGVEKGQIIEIDVRRIRRLRDEPAKEVIYLSSAHLHLQLLYEALFRVWTGTILLQKIILTSQPRALLLYHIKHTVSSPLVYLREGIRHSYDHRAPLS